MAWGCGKVGRDINLNPNNSFSQKQKKTDTILLHSRKFSYIFFIFQKMQPTLDKTTKKVILQAQQSEITEHFIYISLSKSVKNDHNRDIILKIAEDERKHYDIWKQYTHTDISPQKWKIFQYILLSKLFGITFGIKLMEKGENQAQIHYEHFLKTIPNIQNIIDDEEKHEKNLIQVLKEEKLQYIDAIVLGLNDAIVELTGMLAGLTIVLQDVTAIAITGLITGIAASLSMAASEYLAVKIDEGSKNAKKSALYTGIAYISTVCFLILPYLLFSNPYICLGFTLTNTVIIIALFTFYISIVRETSFKEKFFEMFFISMSVSGITFTIGFFVRMFLGE